MLRRWLRALPFVVAVLPPILVGWAVARDAVDVPFWDDWELVDLLERAGTGSLRFGDLWAQHNEHRLLLPNLVMVTLARVTQWDTRVTMAASVVVSLATLAVLGAIIRLTLGRSVPVVAGWVFLGVSLMTFSMVAWQNWLWAWQVQCFMSTLAACVVAWALGRYGVHGPGPLIAALAAIAGTLSLANGVALLVIVPVLLAFDPRSAEPGWRRRPVIAMAVVGALVLGIYLIGYQRPPEHPNPLAALAHPLDLTGFVLAYLGSPLALGWVSFSGGSTAPVVVVGMAYGVIGLVLVLVAGAWLWRRHHDDRVSLMPWIALTLFAILSGAMTAAGRLSANLETSLASRYTTTSALFWVAVIAIAALAVSRSASAGLETSRLALSARKARLLVAGLVIELVILIGYVSSWAYGLDMSTVQHENMRRGSECLRFYRFAPPWCLQLLYPDVAGLKDRASRLERLGLGPFAPAHREQPLAAYAIVNAIADGAGGIDFFGPDETQTEFILVGWGVNPETHRPAETVLVAIDGEVIGRAVTGLHRPDLASGAPNPIAAAGWTFRFSAFRLLPGSHAIEAYAAAGDKRLVKLRGARTIDVKPRS